MTRLPAPDGPSARSVPAVGQALRMRPMPNGRRGANTRRGERKMMRGLGLIVCTLAGSALGGCTTVSSLPTKSNELRSGLTYYLPRREVRITAERKLLKKEELEKALAAAKPKAEAAKAAAAAAKTALENEEKILAQLAQGTPAWNTTEQRRAIFAAQKALADAASAAAQSEEQLIQQNLVRLGTASVCLYSYTAKLELLAPVADLRQRFVANLTHSPLRDDDVKLAVNPAGLLTSANVVATDRTADIIVEAAGALAQFGGVRPPVPSATAAVRTSEPACAELPAKFAYQFDPLTGEALVNEQIKRARFPFVVDVVEQDCAGCASGGRSSLVDPDRMGRNRGQEMPFHTALEHRGRSGALFYVTPAPVTLVLRQCLQVVETCALEDTMAVDSAQVMLPQAGPVSYIPMHSSAFVKTINDATFDNGTLASWTASRPSELLEIVRLPVRVLTSIISVPAQMLSLRVNLSDQEQALAATRQEVIRQQTQLRCMELAVEEERPPESCLPD